MHLQVVDPGIVDAEGLARAERAGDRVLLVADGVAAGTDHAWRDFCLRQSDAVVLVARAGSGVPADGPAHSPSSRTWWSSGALPAPAERVAWVAATDAWRLTVADGDLRLAAARHSPTGWPGASSAWCSPAAGPAPSPTSASCVSWRRPGYHVDRVAGSSIGSVVAAIHAIVHDGEELEERCYAEFVRRNPFNDWALPDPRR